MEHDSISRTGSSEAGEIIIPGLPNDVALQCLLRVPRIYHHNLRAVCKSWHRLLHSRDFFTARLQSGLADAWLIVIFMDLVQSGHYNCCVYDLTCSKAMLCRFILPEPLHSSSSNSSCSSSASSSPNHSPPRGSISTASPTGAFASFKTASIGTSLIVVESKTSSYRMLVENHTQIFDTVFNRWRQGATLITPRSHFIMAAIGTTVYVAGGYNFMGDFETSTECYDLATDQWRQLSNMPSDLERVDGEVVFQGKIYARGFSIETQECVMLVYDPELDTWSYDSSGMNTMDHGELVATAGGIYNLTTSDVLYKFDAGGKQWAPMGQAGCTGNLSPTFNLHAQRAFGLENEIFILGGETSIVLKDGVKCYGLFLGNSWFRAGSIVVG